MKAVIEAVVRPRTRAGKVLRFATGALVIGVILGFVASCSGLSAFGEEMSRKWKGVSATMSTYGTNGELIDKVHGVSFQVKRNTDFDTKDDQGNSNNDSSVLKISIGKNNISHVGSTLVMAQDGLDPIAGGTSTTGIRLDNNVPGRPWLNHFLESNRNLWHGRAKTIMIRSQLDAPIVVFAGNEVEIYPTDVPKSTWYRVDGKYLFVYRANITVYDTALLNQS